MNTTSIGLRAAAKARHYIMETKDGGDPFDILSKQFGRHTDETLKRIEEIEAGSRVMKETVSTLGQKVARSGNYSGSQDRPETWGEQVVASGNLKHFADDRSRPGRFRLDVKANITTGAASGGALGTPFRDPTVTLIARDQPRVRDLLNVVQVTGTSVEYAAQTARPTSAAPVAEGALKPESSMAFALRTTPTQVIAHWIPASRQVLDDAPQLRDLIDTELRAGLAEAEDRQLLTGAGTGSNLLGLIPQATAYVDPLGLTTPTRIDTIAAAILQNALADLPADGVVLHPSDWMRMRLLKDTDGRYILGAPGADVEPVLFGLPVVQTKAMTAGNFLVGNFQAAATLYDRWSPMVTVSTDHADFFVRNLVAILAEERLALAVKMPSALTYGPFGP